MDYTYYLRTDSSSAEVERAIHDRTSAAVWRKRGYAAEPIVVVPAVPSVREMIARSYAFEPDVVISVQVDKFVEDRREREAQALDVLRVLLQQFPGDLYADYYDGNAVLVRRGGTLLVQQKWLDHRSWFAHVLAPATEMAQLAPL